MISDPWIDRSPPRPGERFYKTTQAQRDAAKKKRDLLRSLKQCIAGPVAGFEGRKGIVHGPVVSDCGRCERCLAIRKMNQK